MRPLIEVLKYMQDVAFCDFDELAASMELEKVYHLIDKRDNKSYGIALLRDGNIWMVDDLRLGDGGEMKLTPEDTDIPKDWTLPASYELNSNHKWPTDQHNAYWHKGTLTYYYNFNCAVAMNELPGYTPKNYYPDQSILPKGWKLPGETEVNDLWNAYVKDNDATTLFGVPKFTNAGQIDAGYTATPTNPKVAYYNAAIYDVYDRGGGVNELWSYTYYASTDNSTKGRGTWWSYIGRAVRGVVRKREEGGI